MPKLKPKKPDLKPAAPEPKPAAAPEPKPVAKPKPFAIPRSEQPAGLPRKRDMECPERGCELTFIKYRDDVPCREIGGLQALAMGRGMFHIRRRCLLSEAAEPGDRLRSADGAEWLITAAVLAKNGERFAVTCEPVAAAPTF